MAQRLRIVYMHLRRGKAHYVDLDERGREALKTLCDLWGWEVSVLDPAAADGRGVCRNCRARAHPDAVMPLTSKAEIR